MKDKRNYGIDLLRLVSMLMVVILHVLGQGGVLAAEGASLASHESAWLLESMCICSVNCYALISGYVGLNGRFRVSNILQIWLQAIFYTVIITVLFAVFLPQTLEKDSWLGAFLPVSTGQYWYLTAYVAVYLLSPLINAGIRAVSGRVLGGIVIISSILMIVLPGILQINTYVFNNGYSFAWLLYMYIVGGCIKRCGILDRITAAKALCCYAGSVLLTWLLKFIIDIGAYMRQAAIAPYKEIGYTAPAVFLSALFLFAVFAKLRIGGAAEKLIKAFSPLAFGVYLIHTHPLIFNNVIDGAFTGYAGMEFFLMLPAVLGTALGIFAVCMVLEKVRQLLFKLLRVKVFTEKIDNKINGYLSRSD